MIWPASQSDVDIESIPPRTKRKLKEYIKFRNDKPLWNDRLDTFQEHSEKYKFDSRLKLKHEVRVGVWTNTFQGIGILDKGRYMTRHETFSGNGKANLDERSMYENRLHLHATGTPDDPYVIYGGALKTNKHEFYSLQDTYGNLGFILRKDQHHRISITNTDSFDAVHLPLRGDDSLQRMENGSMLDQRFDYVEVQIHGPREITGLFDAVILYKTNEDPKTISTIREFCQKKGLEFILVEQAVLIHPETNVTYKGPSYSLADRIKSAFKKEDT